MTTGERLKLRRKEIGFSAEKVAEQLGVSPATITGMKKAILKKFLLTALRSLPKFCRPHQHI